MVYRENRVMGRTAIKIKAPASVKGVWTSILFLNSVQAPQQWHDYCSHILHYDLLVSHRLRCPLLDFRFSCGKVD